MLTELQKFIAHGGQVMFYGPIRSKKLQQMFGLTLAAPLTGEMEFVSEEGGGTVLHQANFCGGAINLDYVAGLSGSEVTAWYRQGTKRLPAAVMPERFNMVWRQHHLGWRGTNSFKVNPRGHLPENAGSKKVFLSGNISADGVTPVRLSTGLC